MRLLRLTRLSWGYDNEPIEEIFFVNPNSIRYICKEQSYDRNDKPRGLFTYITWELIASSGWFVKETIHQIKMQIED